MKKICPIFFLIILLFPNLSYGAGAYLVDDGGIVEDKKVQIENWYSRSTTGEDVYVSNLGAQLLKNAEFATQETYSDKSKTASTLWPQIKYRWFHNKKITTAATIGVNYSSSQQKTYGHYAYSSTTVSVSDATDVHFYVGLQNWRHPTYNNKSTDFLNYGVGTEIHLDQKLSLTAEMFQANGAYKAGPTKPAMQFGSRYYYANDSIFDVIYGKNINGNNQSWMTFGVTFLF